MYRHSHQFYHNIFGFITCEIKKKAKIRMSRKLNWLSRFAGTCHAKLKNIVLLSVFFFHMPFQQNNFQERFRSVVVVSNYAVLHFSFFFLQYCTKLEATRHTNLTVFLVRKPVVKRNLEINLMLIIASGSISACQSIKTTMKQIHVPNPILIITA